MTAISAFTAPGDLPDLEVWYEIYSERLARTLLLQSNAPLHPVDELPNEQQQSHGNNQMNTSIEIQLLGRYIREALDRTMEHEGYARPRGFTHIVPLHPQDTRVHIRQRMADAMCSVMRHAILINNEMPSAVMFEYSTEATIDEHQRVVINAIPYPSGIMLPANPIVDTFTTPWDAPAATTEITGRATPTPPIEVNIRERPGVVGQMERVWRAVDDRMQVQPPLSTHGSYCPVCEELTEDDASCNCRECGNPRGEPNE